MRARAECPYYNTPYSDSLTLAGQAPRSRYRPGRNQPGGTTPSGWTRGPRRGHFGGS